MFTGILKGLWSFFVGLFGVFGGVLFGAGREGLRFIVCVHKRARRPRSPPPAYLRLKSEILVGTPKLQAKKFSFN